MIEVRVSRLPGRKQLSRRGREHRVVRRRAMGVSGKAASSLTLATHKVATAMASQRRLARSGSVMRVCCHCRPPRFVSLQGLRHGLIIPVRKLPVQQFAQIRVYFGSSLAGLAHPCLLLALAEAQFRHKPRTFPTFD
jgi:hypothetical protein